MKRLLIPLVLIATLAGCAGFQNPLTNRTEAAAETAYVAAAELATAYLALPFCAEGTHFAVVDPCKETPVIRSVKSADNVAYTALSQVRAFHADHPGEITNVDLITAAISAATAMRSVIPLKTVGG